LSVVASPTESFYFTHLAWAAILWIVGIGLWGIYLVRRIRRSRS